MINLFILVAIFIGLVIPMGRYLYLVTEGEKTVVDSLLNPIDQFIYKVCGIKKVEMSWKKYAVALLLTNLLMIILSYIILRTQSFLFLNPNSISNMESSSAFNTAISFMTNTDLQHYAGESGVSYFSQMSVMTVLMFTSAATGLAAFMAFTRGITGKSLGNFYVDIVRSITRILLPISFIVGLLLVIQGVPQNFGSTIIVDTIEGTKQAISTGPIASFEAIKHIGTNGGGFLSGNSATPIENPTVLSNIIEILSMMLLPGSCVIAFGLMFHYRKREEQFEKKQFALFGAEGKTIFVAMLILFISFSLVTIYAENQTAKVFIDSGISDVTGNMEGKEMRFGPTDSAIFTTVTTAFTTGSVNNMHDSLTPIGGMIPMLLMMLNVVFGGIGTGFMNMISYVILTVFLACLMIGRTPEYLGKKIESKEIKLIVISILIQPVLILGFTALALVIPSGNEAITNPGFHGLSQVLYEYSSSAANNGSGFEGLADSTFFWNLTTAIVMFFGHYIAIIIQLAVAGSLLAKNNVNETIGTLKTNNMLFASFLTIIVLVFAALTFFPVLALGPIAEMLTSM